MKFSLAMKNFNSDSSSTWANITYYTSEFNQNFILFFLLLHPFFVVLVSAAHFLIYKDVLFHLFLDFFFLI